MWKDYVNDTLSLRFQKIWGNAPLPRKHRLLQLARRSTDLSRLKWLSQQLYARRVVLFADAKISYQEWCEKSQKETAMLRKEIAKTEPSAFEQDKVLFDTGARGSLEIRLFKLFRRRLVRLSYMDKNYEEEIEDLERGLFGVPRTTGWWDMHDALSYFTTTNVAILGFFPLLELTLKRFKGVLGYFPGRSEGSRHAFYALDRKGVWNADSSLINFCQGIGDALHSLIPEFRDMVEEKLEFTSSQIPVDASDISLWFSRLFERGECSSREFVNLFEAAWMFTEYADNNREMAANELIRREAVRILTRHESRGDVFHGVTEPTAYKNEKCERVKGEETFKEVFSPTSTISELQKNTELFATLWREKERDGKIRKTVVQIDRWK
jgi:hypothetical protein